MPSFYLHTTLASRRSASAFLSLRVEKGWLIFRGLKKTKLINFVAVWILLMQLLDLYVVVLPALHRTGFSPSILDLLSLVGIGGTLGWLFLKNIVKSPLFPTRDPRLAGSLKLTN